MPAAVNLRDFTSICRKIVAVGRNYRDHAMEMKSSVPKEPILFLKPPSSFLEFDPNSAPSNDKNVILLPQWAGRIDHEVELGIFIGKQGSHIKASDASGYIGGYALGLDLTARDLQVSHKKYVI